jgi:hypothetical protein
MEVPSQFEVLNGELARNTCAPNPRHQPNVLKLLKNLYGLKDAGLTWFEHLKNRLIQGGLKQSLVEPCIFVKGTLILLVYVDDCIALCPRNQPITDFIESMKTDYVLTGGLFIRHHPQRHFLGSTRYYSRTPVWKLLTTVTFLGPLLPPIVLFRPSIVRFVSFDIYGVALCASTPHCRPALCIAKRSSLFFATMEEAMLFTLRNSVERATFHRIPPMLVFWMSTLSVS